MMRPIAFILLAGCTLFGCGGGDSSSCTDQDPCPEGYSCDTGGTCVETPKFQIVTEELDRAAVNTAYEFTVEVSGGIPPYHTWALETDIAWLEIEPDSGVLSGTPDQSTFGTEITVRVNDSSYGDGATTSKSFMLMVTDCDQDGVQQDCFQPEGGLCKTGTQTCQDEKWTDCAVTGPSVDAAHCGPDCSSCDLERADRCNGTCACGAGLPCQDPAVCCTGACADPSTSTSHCGGCGQDCAVLAANTSGAHCEFGECDYNACLAGFLDCNDDRSDGCEVEVDAAHCGSCAKDCSVLVANAEGVVCEERGGGGYDCNYTDCTEPFGDCDGNRQNGCEVDLSDPLHCGLCNASCFTGGNNKACVYIDGVGFRCGCATADDCLSVPEHQCCNNRCFELADPAHCGDCTTDCSQSPLGPLCVDPGGVGCGCFNRTQCGGHNLCCNQVCTPVDEDHCGDCAIACEAVYCGDSCDVDSETCYCTGNPECAGYGNETCEGSGVTACCGD